MQRALVKSLDGKMYYGDVDVSKTQHSHMLVKKIAEIKRMPHGFMTDLLHIDMAVQYTKIWLNPKKGTDLYDGFSELMFLYDAQNGIGNDKEILDFLNVRDSVEILTLFLNCLGQAETIKSNGFITHKDAEGVQVSDADGYGRTYIPLDKFCGFHAIFTETKNRSIPFTDWWKRKITFDFSRAAVRNKTLIKLFEDETK